MGRPDYAPTITQTTTGLSFSTPTATTLRLSAMTRRKWPNPSINRTAGKLRLQAIGEITAASLFEVHEHQPA
jgi:hypothetical protein